MNLSDNLKAKNNNLQKSFADYNKRTNNMETVIVSPINGLDIILSMAVFFSLIILVMMASKPQKTKKVRN